MTASHQSPLVQSQAHTASNHSMQSQPSSWSSDTTQGTTHSTLFNVPNTSNPNMPPTSGGLVIENNVAPSENIMNSVADASSSLFQICVSLRQRLLGVPGFNDSLLETIPTKIPIL
jgi:cell division control protein 24